MQFFALVMVAVSVAVAVPPTTIQTSLADRIMTLSRDSSWKRVASIPIGFPTYHPQGMVKIGDTLFVSSVEVTVPTKRFASADRRLRSRCGARRRPSVQDRPLKASSWPISSWARADIHHPGGIDYDGRFIWVAVAEYRPDSRAIVYRVDPATMTATEVLRVADHIGGIVRKTAKPRAARSLLGRAALLSLDAGRPAAAGRRPMRRRRVRRQPLALRRLSGLPPRDGPADAVSGVTGPGSRRPRRRSLWADRARRTWTIVARCIRCHRCCGPRAGRR